MNLSPAAEPAPQALPGSCQGWYELGLALMQRRDRPGACKAFLSALALEPAHSDTHYHLGHALSALGQAKAAQQAYAQALRHNPAHLEAALALAALWCSRGHYEGADLTYRLALMLAPERADLHFLQAHALHMLKRYEQALQAYERAIALKPDYAEAYYNRGNALKELKRVEEALASYDRAIALKPDYAQAYLNRGNALKELKRMEEALASYDRAIALKPDYADAYYNRGVALKELKRVEEALASYDRAIALKPDYSDAYSNCGNALQELKRVEEALASYDRAIALKPDYADAYYNRGNALQELKRVEEALASYDRAIAIKPDYFDAYYNRGNALQELKRVEEALASYDRAIALKPDYAQAYLNRGVALKELKRMEEALASYDRAIALKPDYAEAYWNKSLALLVAGEFAQGWELYEWRWKRETFTSPKRNFSQPLWLGTEDIVGKTLLLHAEQGLGDTIQFCRYAKLVKALGARVILEVPKALLGLLSGLEGVDELIEKGKALPAFDCHCPLLSLPLAFKTDLTNIPSPKPYLAASSQKTAEWAQRLGAKSKPRVGLVWSGSTAHKNDPNRSLTLQQLLPHLPGCCEYVSLQKEVREVDVQVLEGSGIGHYEQHIKDFVDTAALCQLMDLVISVDTSVAHLAGALGKTTWVLLPYAPDWRWLLDRDDSPWYESVKLYRQDASREWLSVLETLDNLTPRPPQKPVRKPQAAGKAAALQPQSQLAALFKQGLALHQQGQLAQAQLIYQQVLAKQPQHFDALHLSGVIAAQSKSPTLAMELIGKALEINPNNAVAYYNRGNALKELKRVEEALASYDRAIALKPDYAQAYSNRGVALQELKRVEEALASHDRAIALKPDYADAYYNRGVALKELKRVEEALASYDRAIALKPDCAEAYYNCGNALQELKRVEEALASHDRAIALKPDYSEAYLNRGVALKELKRVEEALASYDRAIALKPDYAEAYWNKSLALLVAGEFAQGWELYEWRWKDKKTQLKGRSFSQPVWLGTEDIVGKTLLLHAEQGLGDTIQFCRYAKLVKALGARVILEVPKALLGLLSGLEGVDELIEKGKALPAFDCHCPLLSLPLAFKTDLTNIPSPKPYLAASSQKTAEWAQRLGAKSKPRVGLVWSGSTAHKNDPNRSLTLQQLLPHLPGCCEYVSLQKEVREADVQVLEGSGIGHYEQHIKDFVDTAALCQLMDLVISVDTSVAHLAGALGKTTWVLLPYAPDWRWLLDRDDSPWYESVKLYRQDASREWLSVLETLEGDL
jgi:tetratricopeptide (TPR) repeat protein/ADP-heptose:LPS heptosyltransferase